MNRKNMFVILPIIALALMSCSLANVDINLDRETVRGTGTLQTEAREVRDIERVTLQDVGNLTIIQGDEEGLSVEANENLHEYLVSEMRGRELVLKVKDGYQIASGSTIRYTLRVMNLDRVTVAGAGNVDAERLETGDLALIVSGAGNVTIEDLQASSLRAEASGAGNFTLQGQVESQDLTITGVGNYNAGDLQSGEASVTINGAGECTVWAEESLDVRISGFGSLKYYGSPRVTQSITGSGGVDSLGEHP